MNRKTAVRVIIYYFVYQLLLVPLTSKIVLEITGDKDLAIASIAILSVLVLLLMIFSTKKYLAKCFKSFNINYLIYPIFGYITYYAIVTVVSIILMLTSGESFPVSENQDAIQNFIANGSLIVAFTMIVIVAPLMEELVFRSGIIYAIQGRNTKRNKMLIFLSYAASIFIFSFMHTIFEVTSLNLQELVIVTLPYLVLSSILLYCFVKTKYNIFTSVILHLINNSISFILLAYFT